METLLFWVVVQRLAEVLGALYYTIGIVSKIREAMFRIKDFLGK